MKVRPLTIDGAWELTPVQHGDARGLFAEAFKGDLLAEVIGHRFDLAQVNLSVSAAGVLRGVHFADVPPGQAKYVTCASGAILDVIVDIRVGSPTFGTYDTVLLDDVDRRAVYLSEGLGHAFCALADNSTVTDNVWRSGREVGIEWPTQARDGSLLEYELSEKDTAAPGLTEARESGLLPDYDDVMSFLQGLAAE